MGLKQENFIDQVYITVTATGAAATGLSPTCTVIDESDNRAVGTVAEVSNGWYKVTDFTPDADGTWKTEWAVAGAYTIHYPFKIFKVGGGQEGDILADTNELQTDWVNGGRLDLLIDAALADTNELQTDWVNGGRLDLLIDAIVGDTNELQTDWVNGGRLDNILDGRAPASEYDTEMARITANVATEAKQDIIDTNVDDIETDTADMQPRVPRITCSMDFWTDNDDEIVLTTTATDDHALPNLTVAGIPTGVTVIRVVAFLKIALIKDTSTADNAVNAATALKVDADVGYGSLVTAIDIADNSWAVDVSEATERGGDVLVGDNDVKAEITGNGTWYARLENIACDGNNLKLKDVAWGVRVYFTV